MATRTYSVAEVAELFGVSRDSVYKKIAGGELEALRFGRRTVIPKRAVHELLGEPTPQEEIA